MTKIRGGATSDMICITLVYYTIADAACQTDLRLALIEGRGALCSARRGHAHSLGQRPDAYHAMQGRSSASQCVGSGTMIDERQSCPGSGARQKEEKIVHV